MDYGLCSLLCPTVAIFSPRRHPGIAASAKRRVLITIFHYCYNFIKIITTFIFFHVLVNNIFECLIDDLLPI